MKLVTPVDKNKAPVANDLFAPKKGFAMDRDLAPDREVFKK